MDLVNAKLDELINAMKDLTEKVQIIDVKVSKLDNKVSSLDKRMAGLDVKVSNLEEHVTALDSETKRQKTMCEEFKINLHKSEIDVTNKFKEIECNLKEKLSKIRQDILNQELYSKRFNLLIHGISEDTSKKWESQDETEEKFNDFISSALDMDPNDIYLADIHRLPQFPISKGGKRINRPIIIKLTSSFDKQQIMRSLWKLKEYNQSSSTGNSNYTYVTEHLPREFQQQRKSLLPQFKSARLQNKRTAWKIEDGRYCLYVDGHLVNNPA